MFNRLMHGYILETLKKHSKETVINLAINEMRKVDNRKGGDTNERDSKSYVTTSKLNFFQILLSLTFHFILLLILDIPGYQWEL